jgi:hypothetical protein
LIRALETTAAVSNCCDKIFLYIPIIAALSVVYSNFGTYVFQPYFCSASFMALIPIADTPPIAIWLIPVSLQLILICPSRFRQWYIVWRYIYHSPL